MALLVIEGFDQYGAIGQMGRGGWGRLTTGTLETGRFTGKSYQIANDFNSNYIGFPPTDFVVVGFAYNPALSLPNSTVALCTLFNGTTTQLSFRVISGGEIECRRSTSVILGTTTGAGITAGNWCYIEIKTTIANSGGSIYVQVDGTNVGTFTSLDTHQSGSIDVSGFLFQGSTSADHQIDDLYILDDAGTDATDFLGDCQVETLFPNANGNENDFTRVGGGTSNYEAVDDGATPDDDTTYNWSATATDRELYNFGNITGNVDTVHAVDAKMLARKEDPGNREVRTIARSSVTEVESASKGVSTEYRLISNIYENDPNGGGNWTESAVNAAEFGLDLHA